MINREYLKQNFKSILFIGLLITLTAAAVVSAYLISRTSTQAPTPIEAEAPTTREVTPTPKTTPTVSPTPILPTESTDCRLTIHIQTAEEPTPTLSPTLTPSPGSTATPTPGASITPGPSLTPSLTPTLPVSPSPTLTPTSQPTPTEIAGAPEGVEELPDSGGQLVTTYLFAVATLILLTGSLLVFR